MVNKIEEIRKPEDFIGYHNRGTKKTKGVIFMDKHEKRMIDLVNRNHNLKVIEDQTNAFAARLNAIAARRRKRGKKQ